jgi:hypothetical protein
MLYLWGLLAIATVGSFKLHIAKIIRLAHAQAPILNTVPSAFTQTGRYPTGPNVFGDASETTERPITPPPTQLGTSPLSSRLLSKNLKIETSRNNFCIGVKIGLSY